MNFIIAWLESRPAWFRSKNITTHTVGGFIVLAATVYDSSAQVRDYVATLLVGYPMVVTKIGVLAANIVAGVTLWRNYATSRSDAGVLAAANQIKYGPNCANAPTAAQVDAATTK
jgi:hypothetical protein